MPDNIFKFSEKLIKMVRRYQKKEINKGQSLGDRNLNNYQWI